MNPDQPQRAPQRLSPHVDSEADLLAETDADGGNETSEVVVDAPELTRKVKLMVDGRRITYYRRGRE